MPAKDTSDAIVLEELRVLGWADRAAAGSAGERVRGGPGWGARPSWRGLGPSGRACRVLRWERARSCVR